MNIQKYLDRAYMQEFLAQAYSDTRLSKKRVINFIEGIVEEGREPTLDDLAVIYRHLMPTTRPRLKAKFTNFEWVAAAAGEKDIRPYLNWVYADGENIVATDGHRLHVMKDDREPGYYCPIKGVKVHDTSWHTYPDYKRAMPDVSKGYSRSESVGYEVCAVVDGKPAIKLAGSDIAVQKAYWVDADALNCAKTYHVPVKTIKQPNPLLKPVMIDMPAFNAKALIMPFEV